MKPKKNLCRICVDQRLKKILSLGKLSVSDFIDLNDYETKKRYSLDLGICPQCNLVQLMETHIHPDSIYRHYWYQSGTNMSMVSALKNIVRSAESKIHLQKNDIVVDIGANDGTLLRQYNQKNIITVGFEPAKNLIKDAKKNTNKIFNNYFNYTDFHSYFREKKAKIITSIAMFYDLEHPDKFVEDVKKILADNGIWIIQMSYLPSMLENNAFDNICHEHIEYYSLSSLKNLLSKFELQIFDVELNDINGGSFRTFITHRLNTSIKINQKKLNSIQKGEYLLSFKNLTTYNKFKIRIKQLKKETKKFIQKEILNGKIIYGYGASTKGNTLLQFYNLNNNLLPAIADRNSNKWHKKTIGTNIPIISEDQMRERAPDYLFILPWHFTKGFLKREKAYLQSGGHFIVPLPKFTII